MKYLSAVVDLPFPTPAGRIVTRPGYDADSLVYFDAEPDYSLALPLQPTPEDVRSALVTMMKPWRGYQFASPDDAACMVSGVLASVCRASLELCPAYLFDANSQGAGKTRCAQSLGAVIEGERPAVTPYAGSATDDELRKRIIAGGIAQTRFQCLDNVTGFLKSSVLAAVLTTGKLSDRVLGQSRNVTVRDRSLFTLTGNNASADADLQRRIVWVRLNAGERPTHRAFDFCPVSEALAQRLQIAEAACVIWRAYFNAGAPDIIPGDVGGFADWNRLCRQPLLWLAREGFTDVLQWEIGDPAASMLADPADSDPELEALGSMLGALWALTDGQDFTSAEALKWFRTGEHDDDGSAGDFRSGVMDCAGKADISVRSLGRILMNRRERTVGGLKLLARGGSARLKSWRVVLVE